MTIGCNFTVGKYGSLIEKTSIELGLPPYSSHSARAGFVSDKLLEGWTRLQMFQSPRHKSGKKPWESMLTKSAP